MPLKSVIIEHLEPILSKWMLIEYKHASKIVGRNKLIITNVKRECEREILSKYATVFRESIVQLDLDGYIIILDPVAKKNLEPKDFEKEVYVVIGGIMGSHPPENRTNKMLTSRLNYASRNIGKFQFTIDGAVFMAYMVSKGYSLDEIDIQVGVEIKTSYSTIFLPYAYPVIEGKPLISDEEIKYLIKEIEDVESRMISGGELEGLC